MTGVVGSAHDFESMLEGGGGMLYYNITGDNTVCITYRGSIADQCPPEVRGDVVIPDNVQYRGKTYTVTAIGSKAFENAVEMTSVDIPSSIKSIGAFAFEGCSALRTISFPESSPEFGSGVFFRCDAVENINFGKRWTVIDLTMFRWSNSLKRVEIPALTKEIKGDDKIKSLAYIEVDPANSEYRSVNGIVYDKKGEILLICPRSYGAELTVSEKCQEVAMGALEDATLTEILTLPASLQDISFHETYRMKNLKKIVVNNPKPIMTGTRDEKEYFFFQLDNTNVEICVPKASKELYIKALPTEKGSYIPVGGEVPYMVSADQLPTAKNIKAL